MKYVITLNDKGFFLSISESNDIWKESLKLGEITEIEIPDDEIDAFMDSFYLYKLVDGSLIKSEEEYNKAYPPLKEEELKSDSDVALEVALDNAYRISLLQLGGGENV